MRSVLWRCVTRIESVSIEGKIRFFFQFEFEFEFLRASVLKLGLGLERSKL